MTQNEPAIVVINAVEAQGHCFQQHPGCLTVWRCRWCGQEWLVHPDRNPTRQLQRDASMMFVCPKRPL